MGDRHPLLPQTVEQRVTEMQSRSGCRDGTRLRRITGLVARLIIGVMACDVGRQGHFAVTLQQAFDRDGVITTGGELNHTPTSGLINSHHLQGDGLLLQALQPHLISWPELLGRPCQTKPLPVPPRFQHQQLRLPTACTSHPQPGTQHARVIHHQQIAGPKLLLPVPHLLVADLLQRGISRGNHQQAGRVARLHR